LRVSILFGRITLYRGVLYLSMISKTMAGPSGYATTAGVGMTAAPLNSAAGAYATLAYFLQSASRISASLSTSYNRFLLRIRVAPYRFISPGIAQPFAHGAAAPLKGDGFAGCLSLCIKRWFSSAARFCGWRLLLCLPSFTALVAGRRCLLLQNARSYGCKRAGTGTGVLHLVLCAVSAISSLSQSL